MLAGQIGLLPTIMQFARDFLLDGYPVQDITHSGCFCSVPRLVSVLCYPGTRVGRILHDIPDGFHYCVLVWHVGLLKRGTERRRYVRTCDSYHVLKIIHGPFRDSRYDFGAHATGDTAILSCDQASGFLHG